MVRFLTFALFIAAAAVAVGAPAEAVAIDGIKDKVSISLGQVLRVQFTAEGDRLLKPTSIQRAGADQATVEIKLEVTDSTPFRVQGVATRPYLVVSNGFGKALGFRALARLKGSKDFFEVGTDMEPIEPGEHGTQCWESGSLVEEVVLHQFALVPKPAK